VNHQTVKRHAPVEHYLVAIAFGTALTIGVSLVVGASNPADFWLAAGIGALTAAYPSLSLGVWIFVSNHTVTRDPRGEESVEVAWMKQAASGAFLDVLIAMLVVTAVLMTGRFDVDALPVLLVLIALSVVDAGLRYLVNRHRALR
jgi:hypothetical protein